MHSVIWTQTKKDHLEIPKTCPSKNEDGPSLTYRHTSRVLTATSNVRAWRSRLNLNLNPPRHPNPRLQASRRHSRNMLPVPCKPPRQNASQSPRQVLIVCRTQWGGNSVQNMDYVEQKRRVACNQVPRDWWLSHTDGQALVTDGRHPQDSGCWLHKLLNDNCINCWGRLKSNDRPTIMHDGLRNSVS
jgi:hypothetical protein